MTFTPCAIRGCGALAASVLVSAMLAASPVTAAVTNIASASTVLDVHLNVGSFGPELPASGGPAGLRCHKLVRLFFHQSRLRTC